MKKFHWYANTHVAAPPPPPTPANPIAATFHKPPVSQLSANFSFVENDDDDGAFAQEDDFYGSSEENFDSSEENFDANQGDELGGEKNNHDREYRLRGEEEEEDDDEAGMWVDDDEEGEEKYEEETALRTHEKKRPASSLPLPSSSSITTRFHSEGISSSSSSSSSSQRIVPCMVPKPWGEILSVLACLAHSIHNVTIASSESSMQQMKAYEDILKRLEDSLHFSYQPSTTSTIFSGLEDLVQPTTTTSGSTPSPLAINKHFDSKRGQFSNEYTTNNNKKAVDEHLAIVVSTLDHLSWYFIYVFVRMIFSGGMLETETRSSFPPCILHPDLFSSARKEKTKKPNFAFLLDALNPNLPPSKRIVEMFLEAFFSEISFFKPHDTQQALVAVLQSNSAASITNTAMQEFLSPCLVPVLFSETGSRSCGLVLATRKIATQNPILSALVQNDKTLQTIFNESCTGMRALPEWQNAEFHFLLSDKKAKLALSVLSGGLAFEPSTQIQTAEHVLHQQEHLYQQQEQRHHSQFPPLVDSKTWMEELKRGEFPPLNRNRRSSLPPLLPSSLLCTNPTICCRPLCLSSPLFLYLTKPSPCRIPVSLSSSVLYTNSQCTTKDFFLSSLGFCLTKEQAAWMEDFFAISSPLDKHSTRSVPLFAAQEQSWSHKSPLDDSCDQYCMLMFSTAHQTWTYTRYSNSPHSSKLCNLVRLNAQNLVAAYETLPPSRSKHQTLAIALLEYNISYAVFLHTKTEDCENFSCDEK